MRRLTLDRPLQRNALGATELAALRAALADHPAGQAEPLLLSAVGKVFCAGLDFDYLAAALRTHGSARAALEPLLALYDALLAWPGSTTTLVHGAALGGGFALALCSDRVLAGPRAWFWLPDGPLQPLAAVTLPYLQRRCRGPLAGPDWFGRKIDAEEALALGLVDQIVAPGFDLSGEPPPIPRPAAPPRTLDRRRLAELLADAAQPEVARRVATVLPA